LHALANDVAGLIENVNLLSEFFEVEICKFPLFTSLLSLLEIVKNLLALKCFEYFDFVIYFYDFVFSISIVLLLSLKSSLSESLSPIELKIQTFFSLSY